VAGRGGGIPQGEVSTDNPAAKRGWWTLLISLLGLCQVIVGLVVAQGHEKARGETLLDYVWNIWTYSGLVLLVGGLAAWMIIGWTTRCPFCNRRIRRKDYPRPGYFCPKCGKTVAS